jgi:HK97 family phage portal protein
MKFLNRLFGRIETRREEPSWGYLSGLNAATGSLTNPRMAEGMSAVLACIEAIAGSLAALPWWVYRVSEVGRTVDERHALAGLVRRGPNDHQTWPDFVQWLVASTLLRGNGLAEIVADPRTGELRELRPVPWEWVSVSLLPSGRLAYDITTINGIHGGTGRPRRLLQGEVIHLRDRTDDGLVARSRLQRAAAVVNAGLALQTFVSALHENGLTPSGFFQVDQILKSDHRERLKGNLRDFMGSGNAGKTLVLEAGMKYQPMTITPEDAELLASRRFSVEELARLFQVPPPIIGDLTHGTFTNSETLIRFFAQSTLAGWCRKIEAEFSRSLLGDDHLQVEIDLSGLLRGDPETRWASHKIAVEAGILDTDEVREIEGFAPRRDRARVASVAEVADGA